MEFAFWRATFSSMTKRIALSNLEASSLCAVAKFAWPPLSVSIDFSRSSNFCLKLYKSSFIKLFSLLYSLEPWLIRRPAAEKCNWSSYSTNSSTRLLYDKWSSFLCLMASAKFFLVSSSSSACAADSEKDASYFFCKSWSCCCSFFISVVLSFNNLIGWTRFNISMLVLLKLKQKWQGCK